MLFLGIIIPADTLNRSVNTMWVKYISIACRENKARIAVNDTIIEALFHLAQPFLQERVLYFCVAEFRRAGAELYKEALTILLEAWGGDPDSLRAEIIQGIVHFVELYHGEYDRERLIYSLRAYEPKFIYAAGKAEKELRGVKRYVNLFYRIYNGRRKHEILPMKF